MNQAKLVLDLRRAKQALRLANSVMEYCSGDAWEREVTAQQRKKFNRLFLQVLGEEGSA